MADGAAIEMSRREEGAAPLPLLRRRRTWSWALTVVTLLLTLAGLYLLFSTPGGTNVETWAFPGFGAVVGIALALLGFAVTRRQPQNAIGWILLGAALISAVELVANQYARYTLVVGGRPTDLANLAAWLDGWIWVSLIYAMSVLLFVLFPEGRLPSRRWRWVLAVGAAGGAVAMIATALSPSELMDPAFTNPFGIPGTDELLVPVMTIGILVLEATSVLGLGALAIRLRRAEGVERRQLEWMLAACILVPMGLILYGIFPSKATETLVIAGLLAIPSAAAVAVLRYRLYDIDIIINRTLVYVPLTAFLAGLYAASVALFQRVFVAVTGDRSDAAIIISALVLAAAITPAKNWLQSLVDRRFKPDADPDRRLRAFVADVVSSPFRIDPDRLGRSFLHHVVRATQASAAALRLGTGDRTSSWSVGEPSPDTQWDLIVPIMSGDRRLGELIVGPRPSGRPYSVREREELADASIEIGAAMLPAAVSTTGDARPD